MVVCHMLPKLVFTVEPLVTKSAARGLSATCRHSVGKAHVTTCTACALSAQQQNLEMFTRVCRQLAACLIKSCLLAMAVTGKTTLSKWAFPISMLLVTGQLLFAIQDLLRQENLHSEGTLTRTSKRCHHNAAKLPSRCLLFAAPLSMLVKSHLATFKADITEMTLQVTFQCILECFDSSILLRNIRHLSKIWMGEAAQLPEHKSLTYKMTIRCWVSQTKEKQSLPNMQKMLLIIKICIGISQKIQLFPPLPGLHSVRMASVSHP